MRAWAYALYRRSPPWVRSTAVSAMGAYLQWLRHGGEFDALLREAEEATFASADELRSIRERLWVERMRAAVAAVGAYGRRPLELAEVGRLPAIDKAVVRARRQEFRNGAYRGPVVPLATSGTTGAALLFTLTRLALRRSYAFTWRYRRALGIQPGEWCGVFGGRPVVEPDRRTPPYWQVNVPGRTVLFSHYHLRPETAPLYLEEIRRRQLRWLHGYPSILSVLGTLGLDSGRAVGTAVRWVTTSSETLVPSERAAIARGFGVLPRQQYGSTEGVAMISECPEGTLHVDDDYSLVDFVPAPDGGVGLLGTSLDNESFPLLRYALGDTVHLGPDTPCPCGRAGRRVAAILGRQNDFLVLSDGSRFSGAGFFRSAVHVVQAQILQRQVGAATLRIVRSPEYTRADEDDLRRIVAERVGNRLALSFEYVDALPRTVRGKLSLIVSELPDAQSPGEAGGP